MNIYGTEFRTTWLLQIAASFISVGSNGMKLQRETNTRLMRYVNCSLHAFSQLWLFTGISAPSALEAFDQALQIVPSTTDDLTCRPICDIFSSASRCHCGRWSRFCAKALKLSKVCCNYYTNLSLNGTLTDNNSRVHITNDIYTTVAESCISLTDYG